MALFEHISIQNFIDIVTKENDNENDELLDETVEKIKKIEPENIIRIMILFDEVDDKLNDMKFITKFKVYWFMFNIEIYNKIYNKFVENNFQKNDFLKYFFYSAVQVELIKMYLLENTINQNENENNNENKIYIQAILSVFKDKIIDCQVAIQKLYDYIKEFFYDDEVYNQTIVLLNQNEASYIKF